MYEHALPSPIVHRVLDELGSRPRPHLDARTARAEHAVGREQRASPPAHLARVGVRVRVRVRVRIRVRVRVRVRVSATVRLRVRVRAGSGSGSGFVPSMHRLMRAASRTIALSLITLSMSVTQYSKTRLRLPLCT